MTVAILPTINASLNALAGVFLILGWRAIKAGKRELHKKHMLTAFVCSTVFLCTYVTYHALKKGVVTHYQGQGFARAIYFFILGTHTPLAILIVPFIIAAIRFALQGKFQAHTQITRWLLPVWLYVSVTGVLIYLMLYWW